MPRYKLTIEYDGTPYAGWQRQKNAYTVQAAIEQAIHKCSGEWVLLCAAGRTDAGVHATAQIAHVDLMKDWSAEKLCDALNAHLIMARESVVILHMERMPENFDARFSATARHYLYRIINRRSPIAIEANRAWRVARPLDTNAMHNVAQHLLGKHDFTTFRSSQCQAKSPVKTLYRLDVTRKDELIEIRASARSFLHNQVRSLVGSLVEVGIGRWTEDNLVAAFKACNRHMCGTVAPAHGLYLIGVDYGTRNTEPPL